MSVETRFEHIAIGQHFFVVYNASAVRCFVKKSLSTAYMINLETWERVGDRHNIIEISKAMPVVAIVYVLYEKAAFSMSGKMAPVRRTRRRR